MQAATGRFEMRLEQAELDRIDEWRGGQPDVPSRSEAVRRLLSAALTPSSKSVQLSHGEKLTIWMLCDLFEALKVKSDLDPKFLKSAIVGGQLWALNWKYGGIFDAVTTDRAAVTTVINILDMWRFIESAIGKMNKRQKETLVAETGLSIAHFKFPGFDNHQPEIDYLSIARFFVEELDTFSFLKGRDLDAHFPTLSRHQKMLPSFEAIRPKLVGRELDERELIALMKTWC